MDYITTSDSSLEFLVGAVNGDMSQCLTVIVTNDEIIEGDETFTVALTVNTAGVMEGNTETTVTILTSTTDCEYLLATRDYNGATCMLAKLYIVLTLRGEREISVDEGDGVAEVCVELVFLPNEFPTETNLLINVSTQESKTTKL